MRLTYRFRGEHFDIPVVGRVTDQLLLDAQASRSWCAKAELLLALSIFGISGLMFGF